MQLSKLNKAVLRQLGGGSYAKQSDVRHSAIDAANHGADAGFMGFTYTADTVKFFERNKKEILARLKELADDHGLTVGQLLSQHWRGLEGVSEPLLAVAFGPLHEDYDTAANALAWFALEDCGSTLQNMQEAI